MMFKNEKKPKFKVGDTVTFIVSDDFPDLYEDDPGYVGWVSYENKKENSMHACYKETAKIIDVATKYLKGEPFYVYYSDNGFWWNEHWLRKANIPSKLSGFLNEFCEEDANAS